jgi:drug/metabolite transporter (DMT)-like permease
MKRTDWIRLLALSLLWGGSFLFYRMLATELPPLMTVFSRVSIGALAIWVFLKLRGTALVVPRDQWGRILVVAVLNNVVPFALFAWGETRVASGTASILNALTPIFVVVVTGLVLRTDALTTGKIVGVLCGLAGVVVLVGPDALVGADLLGQAACVLGAVSYGFALPLGKRVVGVAPPVMALAQLGTATLVMLPVVLVFDAPWGLAAPGVSGWVAILGLGLLSTGLGYIIFFALMASAGPTNLSLVTLLIPPSALLLGWGVLGEPVAVRAVVGMVVIGLGLVVIDGRVFRRALGVSA